MHITIALVESFYLEAFNVSTFTILLPSIILYFFIILGFEHIVKFRNITYNLALPVNGVPMFLSDTTLYKK